MKDPAVFIAPVVKGPPLAALLPLQLPPAVQVVGLLVALQLMLELLPAVIEVGLTEMLTTGIAMTVRLADFVSLPALLLHTSVKVFVPAVAWTPVLVLPLELLAPLQEPLAVHEVGLLVALQLIVDWLPVPILVGLTEMVTTGATTGVPPEVTSTLAELLLLPPALLHDRL